MQIKFLTINIWFGGKVWDNLVNFIQEQKPDILALQEVYNGQDNNLEKRFRTMDEFEELFGQFLPFNAFGATLLDTSANVTWGNAVFSKYPITNYQTIFFDLPFTAYNFSSDTDPRFASEGMLEAEIEVDGKKINAYSWHGVWDTHGKDTDSRFIMGDKITESLKDKQNIILAGDTNLDPDTKVATDIAEKLSLVSVFGNSLQSTFNVDHKENSGNYANSAVDMVFASHGFKVLSKEMPQVDISDHFPLLVEFEI